MWIGIMFAYILSIMGILTMGYLLYSTLGIRKGFTPFFSICIILFIEFIFGSAQCLIEGTFFLYIALAIFLIFSLKRSSRSVKDYLRDSSSIFFICMSMLFLILYLFSNQYFRSWDEYSHWGPFAKAMKEFGMLHIYNLNFSFTHPSYQQGEALFYFYFSFFYPKYEEHMLYASYATVLMACLAPFFELSKKWKRRNIFILALFLPLFYRLFSKMDPYVSIYCDVMVGAVAGSLAIYVITLDYIDWSKVAVLCIGMIALVEIKDIGLLFALLNAFLFIIKVCALKQINTKRIIMCIIPIFTIFCQRTYWKVLTTITNNNEDQFTNVSVSTILNGCFEFIRGNDSYFGEVIGNVYNAFISRELSWIPFSTGRNFVILFIVITVVVWNHKNIIIKIQMSILFLTAMGYLVFLFLVYRFTMSPAEVEIVNSFERYYGSFLLMWALVLCYLSIDKMQYIIMKKWVSVGLLLLFVSLLFFEIINHKDFLLKNKIRDGRILSGRVALEEMCTGINEEINQNNAKILIFGTDINSYDMYQYKYMLMPNAVYCRWFDNENYWFENDLSDYVYKENVDYILIINCNEQLLQKYNPLFGEQLDFVYSEDYTGAIYKVTGKDFKFLNFFAVNIR